jgi:hypothetical protein
VYPRLPLNIRDPYCSSVWAYWHSVTIGSRCSSDRCRRHGAAPAASSSPLASSGCFHCQHHRNMCIAPAGPFQPSVISWLRSQDASLPQSLGHDVSSLIPNHPPANISWLLLSTATPSWHSNHLHLLQPHESPSLAAFLPSPRPLLTLYPRRPQCSRIKPPSAPG